MAGDQGICFERQTFGLLLGVSHPVRKHAATSQDVWARTEKPFFPDTWVAKNSPRISFLGLGVYNNFFNEALDHM
jgi:hypothetical protein